MPYVGLVTPIGSTSDFFGTGFRIGILLGTHLWRNLSINVEPTVDILNPKGVASGFADATFDFAFSPLLHLPIANIDLVLGPKIVYFDETLIYTINGNDYNESFTGFLLGVNAGVVVGIGDIAIGGLFSYAGRYYFSPCQVIDQGENRCTYVSGAFHSVSFSGVILF